MNNENSTMFNLKQNQMNLLITLISFCFYIASINSLKCWLGYILPSGTLFTRNFTNIPTRNVCYSMKAKNADIFNYLSGSPEEIAMNKQVSEWIKVCSTDFCNEPPDPPPM